MKPIRNLLVANRGEIACRIIKSASAAGIRTIAIYSDADRDARHLRLADDAYRIGPAQPTESYLNIESIIKLAQELGVDAIHPGYGFLSENPVFAKACEDSSIIFVGPSAASMQVLGNKSAVRRLAITLGIPVRPGYEGDDQDDESFALQAERLGYPLMIKAAAGGGGRGMRAVDDQAQLLPALHAARAEAKNAFGSDQLLLEAFISKARHIEIQIIADHHGNVLSLYERDCSTQRRHQKILEEAPAVGLSAETRQAMSEAAVRLAKAVEYRSAGTVEFLLTADGSFSLLEMNTRLQVEHPVTEAITGIDLVALQLQIAQGQRLKLRQADIHLSGHAIEARLCAEDPDDHCLPQSGPVIDCRWPELDGVRIDHDIIAGVDVPAHYDSMMAKLIAWGEDREQARQRLRRALEHIKLLGPLSNRTLLIEALDQPVFCQGGEHDIAWLEAWMPNRKRVEAPESWFFSIAACILYRTGFAHGSLAGFQSSGKLADGGSLLSQVLELHAQRQDRRLRIEVRSASSNCWFMSIGEAKAPSWQRVLLTVRDDGLYCLEVAGRRIDMLCRSDGRCWQVDAMGFADSVALVMSDANKKSESANGIISIRSRMHGRVLSLAMSPGDIVSQYQTILHIEAMKIQHHIDAPQAGRIIDVAVQDQQQVAAGQVLVKIDTNC